MLFDGVLIASDLDGTLTSPTGEILPQVRDAIRYFIDNGGHFTVCTGRVYLGFHRYSPEIINAPVLLANGGMAYDYAQRKIAVFNGIGPESWHAVRWVRDHLPSLSIELYPFDRACAINMTDKSHRHFTSQDIPFERVEDPAQAGDRWAKMMLLGPREEIL